nr:hypothetical protein [Tanacetum cinerariifolium]
MNYVPVVDAGTNSTNFSGTKVDARKDVNKDMSSLRYIVLPNWVHEEHLESISSQPQDPCNTDTPESSGNSNPTATSTNPSADQVETLTVETPIPSVSSPVLTLCFTDSQEPQFEDTLGVARNLEESNGVEADKTDPALLQFCLFSCFLSQVEPKKISDALQDLSWVEAMQEELLQFKIQNVWTLVDCPKGLRPIRTKWVLKNKKDERGIMDVKSAFLYGTIDEEVYVMQPPRFQDPDFPAKVYKVEKSMYGLHQAPRAWLNMSLEAFSREYSTSIIRLYALTVKPTVYVSHIRQFWSTARIETTEEGTKILATIDGEGLGTLTEPYHIPSPVAQTPSHTTQPTSSLPLVSTTSIPTVTPTKTTPIRQYTRRARIAQSSAHPPDRATIAKSSTLPHDSTLRVTSHVADEGSMQPNITELTVLCTSLQRQHFTLLAKFQAQEVEILKLKDRVKVLEDREGIAATRSGDDAPVKGRNFPEEIFSSPLFEEEIIPIKIDQHHFNVESDLIESMLNHDSSIIPSSSKINSLLDEFDGELTLLKSIPPRIDKTDCHPENEIRLTERLLYDNLSPRPSKEFVFNNSDADIESFSPSPIPDEDSDSRMEEIDLTFTSDDPMPSSIEDDDNDSERDILILEEFPSNYSLSLPVNESFHFDILAFSRPPAKPPDGNTGILNIKMRGDNSEQKVPMPGLTITCVPNQEKSPDLLSHRGLEIFQLSSKCPMMIHGKNIPVLDVPLFHFYPLDQFKYGGMGSSSAT